VVRNIPPPAPTPPRALEVLWVEDNITNLRLTRMMLERLSCRVTTALDGQQALDRLGERRFDVVFMDCQMPQMDGFEAVRRWRAVEPVERRTPVIALTTNAFVEDRQHSLDAGMDDHLTKPVRLDALREALTSWSRSAAA
jgi:CheY-like chemotaxis protein